ncbi:hypothetical protein CYMTET_53319, partial [Cymbomonas tetramitiformis]
VVIGGGIELILALLAPSQENTELDFYHALIRIACVILLCLRFIPHVGRGKLGSWLIAKNLRLEGYNITLIMLLSSFHCVIYYLLAMRASGDQNKFCFLITLDALLLQIYTFQCFSILWWRACLVCSIQAASAISWLLLLQDSLKHQIALVIGLLINTGEAVEKGPEAAHTIVTGFRVLPGNTATEMCEEGTGGCP